MSSAASYDKADPEGKFSQMIAGELRTVPDPPFVVVPPEWPRSGPQRTAAPKVQKQTPEPAPVPRPAPPPWENAGKDLCLNRWIEDRPVWDALLLPYDQRGEGRASVFALLLGADERGVYRNRLFHLRRALDAGGRSWILQTEKPRPPAPSETEAFRLLRVVSDGNHPGPRGTPACREALDKTGAEGFDPGLGVLRRIQWKPVL